MIVAFLHKKSVLHIQLNARLGSDFVVRQFGSIVHWLASKQETLLIQRNTSSTGYAGFQRVDGLGVVHTKQNVGVLLDDENGHGRALGGVTEAATTDALLLWLNDVGSGNGSHGG